ncbi:MAG: ATP-binding protein [Tunicatimonas sp.]
MQMLFNPRGVAVLLGACIALITVAFQSLIDGITDSALLVGFLLAFSSSYLLISVTLEFLVFREVNKIYHMLNQLKRKDLSFVEDQEEREPVANPFRRITQEIKDYTADKQREINDLKKMAEFRKEFVANVSHELKTPIFAAQGFVHTLLDGAVENRKFRYKFLKKAAKSLDGLDILVQDLLTLSQMETGGIKMHYEHFDLGEMVNDVFDQLESDAEKKETTLVLDTSQSSFTHVYADRHRIYQVLINLINNAIKYTKQSKTTITVRFISEPEVLTVSIQDHGRGIPPEDIERIFERFYRVEKSRSKNKGGTGLGLAIVKHILEAHQTKVSVESEVGVGSTFSFRLKRGKALRRRAVVQEVAEEDG